MDTNEDLEHLFDEDNLIIVEEQPREVDAHVIEQASPIINATVGGPRSMVWPEFVVIPASEFDDGKKRATCKHCESKIFLADSRYGTSDMKKHLEKCPAYQATKATRVASGEATRFDLKIYRELVAKAIIMHGYSFSWIEHKGNRAIHAYLNNQVIQITRNTVKTDCLKLNAHLKKKLKDTLVSLPGRICLTCDLWTSCQTEGYMCLTAHYVDSTWKLCSRLLNFRHIEPPHTGSVLCEIVLELLSDWGIQHKIFSITLDNASSNDKMQDDLKAKLMEKGYLLSSGDHFHVRCAAHTLNLIVKYGLKAIDDCIVKIRESVKYVKGSESKKLLFHRCVKRVVPGIKETKALWLDVPTRWNSTYYMLDRALIYRRAFKELYLADPLYMSFPTDEEWERVARIHELLGPFCDITDMFSGSEYPTANLYFENVWKIDMFLKEQSHSRDKVIRDMALNMRAKFDKYWSEYTLLFAFATILDPRCKKVFLKYCYKKLYDDEEKAIFKLSQVIAKLETLLKEYTMSINPPTNVASTTSSSTISGSFEIPSYKRKFNYLAEFDESELDGNSGKTMLDRYLEDPKIERKRELDVMTFWKENVEQYKELSHLARDILSVPLTTVASESTFSIGGRILNKWKSSYIPENVEALITTRSWLYGFESNGEDEFIGCDVEWVNPKPNKLSSNP